jgi:protein gp37
MSQSNIEWTGFTWNPLAGCSVLTPGCKRCYAMRLAKRLGAMGNPLYKGLTKDSSGGAVWTGEVRRAPRHTLLEPLRRTKPTTWFVNSMSDLFHENVPDQWIDDVFAVMALCPQHTFQVLTKRAERMREYLMGHAAGGRHIWTAGQAIEMPRGRLKPDVAWPLPNVWLGVSTERQREADERIPLLLQTPAAVRFISAEPLLAPITLRWAAWDDWTDGKGERREVVDHLDGARSLDWVICGGESGGGARMMDEAWAHSLLEECREAGVAFFMKQMTAKKPIPDHLMVRQFPKVAA